MASGIKARSFPGHVSYVLFADGGYVELSTDLPFGNDPWLKLVEVNHRVVDG